MGMTGGTSIKVIDVLADSGNTRIQYYLYWKLISQDPVARTSVVDVGAYVNVPTGYIGPWTGTNSTIKVTVPAGESVTPSTANTFDGSVPSNTAGIRWVVENKRYTITHKNPDTGSTFNIEWLWNVNSSWGNVTPSNNNGTYSGISLPILSQVTTVAVTNPINSGQSYNYALTWANTAYKCQLKFYDGATLITTLPTDSTYYVNGNTPSYTVAAANAGKTLTIVCETYDSSNNLIGSVSYTTWVTPVAGAQVFSLIKKYLGVTGKRGIGIGKVPTKSIVDTANVNGVMDSAYEIYAPHFYGPGDKETLYKDTVIQDTLWSGTWSGTGSITLSKSIYNYSVILLELSGLASGVIAVIANNGGALRAIGTHDSASAYYTYSVIATITSATGLTGVIMERCQHVGSGSHTFTALTVTKVIGIR